MSLSIFDLTERVAIVTGGGRGIGRAIALGFAEAGADVVVCARTTAEIEDTAAKIRGKGRRALAISTDVTNVDQVTNVLRETLAHFGKVDILVNNAGESIGGRDDILQLTAQQWEAVVERDLKENLTSVLICCKIIGEQMVKQRAGTIINISSVAGIGAYAVVIPYSAAKAGVIIFTHAMAVRWAPYNIRINDIAPGSIETSAAKRLFEKDPKLRQSILERIPLGRLGKPEDIVGAAIYLASDASAYVTGETIVVSGAQAPLAR